MLFLHGLLLAIELAPGCAERRRLVLGYQAHLDRARRLISDRGPADLLEHHFASAFVVDERNSRCAGPFGFLLQYGNSGVRDWIEQVILMTACRNVRLGVAVIQKERICRHNTGGVVHDPNARVVGEEPDIISRLPRHIACKSHMPVPIYERCGVLYLDRGSPHRYIEPRHQEGQPRGSGDHPVVVRRKGEPDQNSKRSGRQDNRPKAARYRQPDATAPAEVVGSAKPKEAGECPINDGSCCPTLPPRRALHFSTLSARAWSRRAMIRLSIDQCEPRSLVQSHVTVIDCHFAGRGHSRMPLHG